MCNNQLWDLPLILASGNLSDADFTATDIESEKISIIMLN